MHMTIDEIVSATGASLVCGAGDAVCTSCAIDSREASSGTLFVAFAGERVDGNDYCASAIEAGASCVAMTRAADDALVELAGSHDAAIVRISDDDAEQFMLDLAAAWRAANPQWAVVGVTGSVGKTTTKDMCAAALSARWRTHATRGNFNNLIGMPLTILSAEPEDEVLVVEMGMNHAGELSRLTQAGRPQVALVTNVGTSHIGFLGSREGIARAKAEIVEGMQPAHGTCAGDVEPCLLLMAHDDFTPLIAGEYAKPQGIPVRLIGSEDGVVHAEGLSLDETGHASFEAVFSDGERHALALTVPGAQVASDALLALEVADILGVSRAEAAAAISNMPAAKMRLEVHEEAGRPRVIDDSYNASPSSMASALDVLCSMSCSGRRIAVLGEIGELGQESERLHGYVGAYAAAKPVDLIVFVGADGAPHMREAAITMGFSEDRLECVERAEDAARIICDIAREDDLVLAKGSRSVGLDLVVKEVLGR